MIKNGSELVSAIIFVLIMIVMGSYLSGCTLSVSADWNGKTEVKKSVHSPETLEKHTWW